MEYQRETLAGRFILRYPEKSATPQLPITDMGLNVAEVGPGNATRFVQTQRAGHFLPGRRARCGGVADVAANSGMGRGIGMLDEGRISNR